MSLLDELITKYSFDKINAATKYPAILDYHKIENNNAINELATANYQPLPPHPEQMPVVIKELIDGEILRIISIDNDFFIGDKDDIIHARGDRIITNPKIIPMYKAMSSFFGANMTNNERLMVLIVICYGGDLSPLYGEKEIKCSIVEGYTIKLQNFIALCRDNDVNSINEWVNTLHQPYWSINTLKRFCTACNLEPLPIIKEMKLNQIPTDITELTSWLNPYKSSSLVFTKNEEKKETLEQKINNTPTINLDDIEKDDDIDFLFKNESKKSAKGIIIRSLDRTYIRKINFKHYFKI